MTSKMHSEVPIHTFVTRELMSSTPLQRPKRNWFLFFGVWALCSVTLPAYGSDQGLREREKLTGDWGGFRPALEDRGIEVSVNYFAETLSILSGGLRPGSSYEGRLDVQVDYDLQKLMHWTGGSIHVRGFQIHKGKYNGTDLVGSLGDPSNIDAVSTTRLFTAWYQQEFGKAASIRVGQLAADDEFFGSPTAFGLINATFGWAPILASNLPFGVAAYPLGTPGARLQINPTERISLLMAAFSGNPVGKGCNDQNPQICNKYGTTFSFDGGAFWIGELQYQVNQDKKSQGLAAAYKIGGWYHTGNNFADQRFGSDPATGEIASLATSLMNKFYHNNNWGMYGVFDQMIWRSNGRSASIFARGGLSPSDRNLVSRYIEGGIGFNGLIAKRPDDTLTFGVAHSKISKDAAALDLENLALNGPPNPIRSAEMIFEISYVAKLAPWWSLQPDIQYIIRPGGNVSNPNDLSRVVGNAFIVGARSTINF